MMRAKTVVIIVALAALLGGGALAATYLISDEESEVATESLVPRNSFFYLETSRALSPEQREACDSLLARFPEGGTCGDIGDKIQGIVQTDLEEEDISFEDDIEPWLGDDFAMYVTTDDLGPLFQQFTQGATDAVTVESDPEELDQIEPTATFLVTVDDEDAARVFFERQLSKKDEEYETRTYEDVDYNFADGGAWAFFDGHMIVGTEAGVKATIDQRDSEEAVEDNDKFSAALEAARDDRLGLLYLDLKPVLDVALQQIPMGVPENMFAGYLNVFDKPITITAHLEDTGMVIESTGLAASDISGGTPTTGTEVESALEALPGGSWGALAVADPAASIRTVVDLGANAFFLPATPGQPTPTLEDEFKRRTGLDLEQDLLGWMGRGGAFVGGERAEDLYGGVMIETSDPATSLRAILRIERLIASGLGEEQRAVRESVRQAKAAGIETIGTPAPQAPTEIISRGDFRGFIMPVTGQEQVGIVAVDDERVVIALGPVSLLDELSEGERLGDSEVYSSAQEALGEGFTMSGFFDIDVIRTLLEAENPGDANYESEVRPYLEPLGHLVFGSMEDGGVSRDRLVIGVE